MYTRESYIIWDKDKIGKVAKRFSLDSSLLAESDKLDSNVFISRAFSVRHLGVAHLWTPSGGSNRQELADYQSWQNSHCVTAERRDNARPDGKSRFQVSWVLDLAYAGERRAACYSTATQRKSGCTVQYKAVSGQVAAQDRRRTVQRWRETFLFNFAQAR